MHFARDHLGFESRLIYARVSDERRRRVLRRLERSRDFPIPS
jgi:hypothetical protein